MNTLDQKLDFTFTANQQIIQLIAEIDLFRGKWEHLEQLHPVFLKELKGMATIQSIGSSTRIEGATLSDKEIEQLIADLKVNKLENRDEQEVIGYYDVLELIFDNAEDIQLTENYIM